MTANARAASRFNFLGRYCLPAAMPSTYSSDERVLVDVYHGIGRITLNRPGALNALDLGMVRALTEVLLRWQTDASIAEVRIRGMGKTGPFGSFCAGGDIRFFHTAALKGDPQLDDFFTEEYRLNHLIFTYGKPYVALMDGVVMGGGMGLSQGASLRIVTEKTKMAMPETLIGLFPDVAGGYFLSRCPGRMGEYLALTGATLGAHEALALGLADTACDSADLSSLWEATAPLNSVVSSLPAPVGGQGLMAYACRIDTLFAYPTALEIVHALESCTDEWELETARILRQRSPLMLEVVLQQVQRARAMGLADELRMERDMVRHCFYAQHLGRCGAATETAEGIRALAVDKDQQPKWLPARLEDVTNAMVQPFFESPWPEWAHPLAPL